MPSNEPKRKLSIALSKRVIKDSTREKHRLNRLGDKCVFWRGGISTQNELERKSLQYRIWRKKVFERDKYTCVECGIKAGIGLGKRVVLQADHIKKFSLYPKLRYTLSNGRTLCIDCHKKTDTYGKND